MCTIRAPSSYLQLPPSSYHVLPVPIIYPPPNCLPSRSSRPLTTLLLPTSPLRKSHSIPCLLVVSLPCLQPCLLLYIGLSALAPPHLFLPTCPHRSVLFIFSFIFANYPFLSPRARIDKAQLLIDSRSTDVPVRPYAARVCRRHDSLCISSPRVTHSI
jgi:hypothetical protein